MAEEFVEIELDDDIYNKLVEQANKEGCSPEELLEKILKLMVEKEKSA